MRLYISLAAAVLAGVVLLSACDSDPYAHRPTTTSPSSTRSSSAPSSSSPGSVRSPGQPPLGSPAQLPTTLPSSEITASGEARRITPAELKDKLARGQAILIDVRGEAAYNQSHIKGSLQIPYAEIANHADELPRNQLIVTYCS